MAKVSVDIEYIKTGLSMIGYNISDCIEHNNNGLNWQLKFSNSGAIVTIYDTNKRGNTVVNGKLEEGEKNGLQDLVERLKHKEFEVDPLNPTIIELIDLHTEGSFYDYKLEMHTDMANFLHDILCLSNNTENKDAYLIYGVNDQGQVEGHSTEIRLDHILDFLKTQHFAGGHMPELEVKPLYYKYKMIFVLVCKASKHVPFYLTEKYKSVFDNQIYTRVGNTNTPKNQHANYNDVEKLWRIHFERENDY